jgi:transcription initiation factor TFIID TATA-box-binding protein
MANPELVNAVGGGDLRVELDLMKLQPDIKGEEVRYDPEQWPGLYIRFESESPAVLLFGTGKYNIAGADSIKQLFAANERILTHLGDLGIPVDKDTFKIRNLVFLDNYNRELNLNTLSVGLGMERTEYEPEQFPGLLYQDPDINGTFLIFNSGKVILTGAKETKAAESAFERIFNQLDDLFE